MKPARHAYDVCRAIGFAGVSGSLVLRRIPGVGNLAAFDVERNVGIVAFRGSHHAKAPVFGDYRYPVTGEVDPSSVFRTLRGRCRRWRELPAQTNRYQDKEQRGNCRNSVTHASVLFLGSKTLVGGFDKHVRCPGAASRSVQWIVISRGSGSLHLLQSHSLFDHVLNPVANDNRHFAIINHVAHVAETSVSGNDQSASLLTVNRYDQVNNLVQPVNDALNAAARGQVDDGVAGCRENIAGTDHIRAAEENNGVAIGMRGRQMENFDALAVKKQLLFVAEESTRRPGIGRRRGPAAGRGAHPVENVFMSDDLGAFCRIADIEGNIAAGNGAAGLA